MVGRIRRLLASSSLVAIALQDPSTVVLQMWTAGDPVRENRRGSTAGNEAVDNLRSAVDEGTDFRPRETFSTEWGELGRRC